MTELELLKEFSIAIPSYEMHTGMMPTRAYLGTHEYAALQKITKSVKISKFSGLKIFEVKDDQPHFRVCN